MRLIKEDWEQLDTLLCKVGFGGYYDLIETLKMIVSNLSPKPLDLTKENDICILIMLIAELSRK